MKLKRTFFALVALIFSSILVAQSENMKYQAVARDTDGQILKNQDIALKFSFRADGSSGTIEYSERHEVSTNEFGLFDLELGDPDEDLTGRFQDLDWKNTSYYLEVEMDPNGGTNYDFMGVSPLMSVPYAKYAESVRNTDDADADPSNEIQNLSLAGNMLSLSNANTIDLSGLGGSGGSSFWTADFEGIRSLNSATIGSADFPYLYLGADHIDFHGGDCTPIIEPERITMFDFNSQNSTVIDKNGLYTTDEDGFQSLFIHNQSGNINAGEIITVGRHIDARTIVSSSPLGVWFEVLTGSPIFDPTGLYWNDNTTGQPLMEVRKRGFYLNNGISGSTANMIVGSSGNGEVNLMDGGAFRIVNLDMENGAGSANFYTSGGTGKLNVHIGASTLRPDAGRIAVFNDNRRIYEILSGSTTGAAFSYLYGSSGNSNVYLGSVGGSPNSGYVSVQDGSGDFEAGMYVNSASEGIVFADIVNATTYNFEGPTDDKSTTKITYSGLSGPEVAAYERGTASIKNGETFVPYSTHYKKMANWKTATIELTPLHWDTYGLAVVEKTKDGFYVKELKGAEGNFKFDWKVTAKRLGHEEYEVIRSASNVVGETSTNQK